MKVKKKSQGITLVSLVITVVIMLILAGVTISGFIDGDGIFNRSTQITREYKKQAMLEAVDLAKAYVELDKSYTNEPITITDVIDKIKEVSTINEKDYIITVDDEEQTATIIDKATGVVVDIWIDENGHVQSDGNIVEDVENLVKPTVTYELDPPAGTYGDEVKITITATEEKNGIVRMVLPDNSEIIYNKEKEVTKEYIVTENGTYKFVVEGANGRKTTKYVEVKNITSVANITMEAQNTNPTNQAVNVLITYDENVKIGGQILVNADRYQYSIGENNWQTATSAKTTIQVGVNGNVYARYYNGTEGFKTTSITIQNIDKALPNEFNLSTTKTTNSITVSGSTEDTATAGCATANYGIRGYQFQLKNSAGSIITNWTTVQEEESYTFSNLTQGTTYKVSMRAIDKAGNITEATNKDTSVVVNTVADSSAKIGISYNPTTATKGNVQVTFKDNSGQSGLTLKYQIGSTEGSWTTYTKPVKMTTNGKVYARLFDNKNQYKNTATATVQNIDKVAPVISSATASTSWGKTNSVTIKATDTGTTGCAEKNIGIVGYGINQSSITEPSYTTVTATTDLNTTINNITANGTYYVWVKDKAGNTANKAVTVNRVDTTAPTTATIASSNVEQTTFTLTATGADGESGIAKYEFYINNTLENTVTTTAGTATYNVSGKTANTPYTCKVIVYDNAGNPKESSEITVTTKTAGLPIATTVQVGDYVNYDAGTWTEADFNKITSSGGSVNKSTAKPTRQGQFGGFTVGKSRNSNSTPYSTSYEPDYEGWRVWDIDESTGEVTLISAGHPETYYHGNNSSTSTNILRNRDYSMYENQYAKSGSAHILTGQEAAEWYNKQFGTNYTIVDNGGSSSTFYYKKFTTNYPIEVLENGSYYWLASPYNSGSLYGVSPDNRYVNAISKDAFGVRVLVSLESGVKVEQGTETGGVTTWDIVGN